ncbi:MAG: TlpA disulfide reductase family protein [Planctomycetota bacterium]
MPAEWYAGSDEHREAHDALVGQPMPPFELEGWRNGELTLEDLEGKIVLVDFWATWCAPCIAAIPKHNQLQADYADQGVVLLAICGSKIGQDKYDQVLDQHPIVYASARDASLEYAPLWHVVWMPTYAIVDRDGLIRGVGIAPDRVEDAIQWLLEVQPADAS